MSAEFDDGKDDGALRTIGEVSKALDIKSHVLRYWEQQFPMLEPLKRSGGRRYYRPADVQLVERIDALVNDQGYTLKGARLVIEDDAAPAEKPAGGVSEAEAPSTPAEDSPAFKAPPVVTDTPIAEDGGLSNFFGDGTPAQEEMRAEELAAEKPVAEAQAAEVMAEAAPEPAHSQAPTHSQTPAEPQTDQQIIPREDIVARLKSIHRTLSEAVGA